MSITDLDVKGVTAGDGIITAFTIPFQFQEDAEVGVYLVSGTVETKQTIVTNYTISGTTVTFLVAPVSPNQVVLIRETVKNQPTDLINAGPLTLANIEKRLDVLTQMAQELGEEISRTFKVQRSTVPTGFILPAPSADKVIGWDTAGTQLENKTLTLTGAPLASQAEAEAGTENTKYMSSLRTKQGFDFFMDRYLRDIKFKTATFTPGVDEEVFICDASGGAIVVNLPAVAALSGKRYTFKKEGTDFNIITLDPNGAEQIDQASTIIMRTPGESVTIIPDGTEWWVIERKGCENLGAITSVFSWVTNVTHTVNYYRNGSFLKVWGFITTSGAPTAVPLTMTLPNSWQTVAALFDAQGGVPIGKCHIRDDGVIGMAGIIMPSALGVLDFYSMDKNGATVVIEVNPIDEGAPITFGADDKIWFEFEVPMLNWID